MYSLSSPTNTGVRRVKSDNTSVWEIAVSISILYKALDTDAAEQNIYIGSLINPLVVVRLKASDGSFVGAQQQ